MDQALREFAAHLGVCEEAPGSQLAGNDWDFLDIDMEDIDLRSLPTSVICCNLDVGVFYDGRCRVSAGGGEGCMQLGPCACCVYRVGGMGRLGGHRLGRSDTWCCLLWAERSENVTLPCGVGADC